MTVAEVTADRVPAASLRQLLGDIAVLVCIALLLQAVAFRFVFPGYYSPLWPHHHDFYVPMSMSSVVSVGDLLNYPRPVGAFFFWAIGHLGLHGSILAVILVVALNSAITGVLLARAFRAPRGRLLYATFAVYAFLLFTNPQCYFMYTWDAFAQLSYLFFAISACGLLFPGTLPLRVGQMTLLLCGFLAKETFAVSLVVLASIWCVLHLRRDKPGSLLVLAAPLAAFVVAALVNRSNSSPFTSGSDDPNAPYLMVLSPASVLSEWLRYLAEFSLNGLSMGMLLLVVGAGFVVHKGHGQLRWLALPIVLAGALALLPNSVLPNHHFAPYAWNAAYLIYAPVFLVPSLVQAAPVGRLVAAAAGVFAIASPTLSKKAYEANQWYIDQEAGQRNLVQALTVLTQGLPSGVEPRRILITGIDFPYAPFDHPYSMSMFPKSAHAELDVVAVHSAGRNPGPRNGSVRLVAAEEVELAQYDRIWAFRADGTLLAEIRFPHHFAHSLGAASAELLTRPQLLDDLEKGAPAAGPPLLGNGAKLPLLPARALASSIETSDRRAEHQLLEGFYHVEFDRWRWTAAKFAARLAAPAESRGTGAKLRLTFNIPSVAYQRYGVQRLSAKIGDRELAAATFTDGDHEFVADVPGESVAEEAVRVDFALDKSFVPGGADDRELGVIVSKISLETRP